MPFVLATVVNFIREQWSSVPTSDPFYTNKTWLLFHPLQYFFQMTFRITLTHFRIILTWFYQNFVKITAMKILTLWKNPILELDMSLHLIYFYFPQQCYINLLAKAHTFPIEYICKYFIIFGNFEKQLLYLQNASCYRRRITLIFALYIALLVNCRYFKSPLFVLLVCKNA